MQLIQISDLGNSLLQVIAISIVIFYCVGININEHKVKFFILNILLFIVSSYFTSILGNLSVCIFITHILCLITVMIIFKDHIIESIIGYTIVYSLISLLYIVTSNILYGFLHTLLKDDNSDLLKFITIYLPQVILFIGIFLKRKSIREIFIFITNKSQNVIILIITSFILDFLLAFNLIIYSNESGILKNLTLIII